MKEDSNGWIWRRKPQMISNRNSYLVANTNGAEGEEDEEEEEGEEINIKLTPRHDPSK